MAQKLKIFVIDDALGLCRDLLGWLSAAGHQVTCGQASRTLIYSLVEYEPTLIVLGMAGYSDEGMNLYRRLSSHRQLRHVPMIVVSDDASFEYEMLDVFDFQVRPLNRERLDICLERLSGSSKYLPGVTFADAELTELKGFLLKHSGLHFSQHNYRILERGLMRRVQTLRMESFSAYFKYLTATSTNYDEVNKLLGLLTVGETSFFRYRSHREALLNYIIPELMQKNQAQCKLRIWSAGCSTGEEPYSLAILLLEHFPALAGWDVQILATDINKRALRKAREGIYNERSLRTMEHALRERYFEKKDNHFLLSAQVKRMVRFDFLNLQTDHFPAETRTVRDLDFIFCRNVLIYFELETIRQIVTKFSQVLKPDGYLLMGHSETMQNVSDRFQRHYQNNAFFYQLKDSFAATKGSTAKGLPKAESPEAPTPVVVAARKNPTVVAAVPQKTPTSQRTTSVLPDPDRLYCEALAAFDHEKFVEAARLFELLLEQQPGNPRALVGKGLLLANQGKYSDARLFAARAVKEDDLLPEAYLLRGLILDMEGLFERALVEYQKVLWLAPLFVMAHYFSAKIYERLSDTEKKTRALRNTLRALEQDSDQSTIPFSGGLTRAVFIEIVNRELVEEPTP